MKHRILKDNEKIKEGDEYRGDYRMSKVLIPKQWTPIWNAQYGQSVKSFSIGCFIYRRKVK